MYCMYGLNAVCNNICERACFEWLCVCMLRWIYARLFYYLETILTQLEYIYRECRHEFGPFCLMVCAFSNRFLCRCCCFVCDAMFVLKMWGNNFFFRFLSVYVRFNKYLYLCTVHTWNAISLSRWLFHLFYLFHTIQQKWFFVPLVLSVCVACKENVWCFVSCLFVVEIHGNKNLNAIYFCVAKELCYTFILKRKI